MVAGMLCTTDELRKLFVKLHDFVVSRTFSVTALGLGYAFETSCFAVRYGF